MYLDALHCRQIAGQIAGHLKTLFHNAASYHRIRPRCAAGRTMLAIFASALCVPLLESLSERETLSAGSQQLQAASWPYYAQRLAHFPGHYSTPRLLEWAPPMPEQTPWWSPSLVNRTRTSQKGELLQTQYKCLLFLQLLSQTVDPRRYAC